MSLRIETLKDIITRAVLTIFKNLFPFY